MLQLKISKGFHCRAPNHIGLHLPYDKLRKQHARKEEMVRRLYNLRRVKAWAKGEDATISRYERSRWWKLDE